MRRYAEKTKVPANVTRNEIEKLVVNLIERGRAGRRRRVIEALRRHPHLGGEWTYDRDRNEWVRADGVKVYARARISFSPGGCESYYSTWYVETPVHGPVREVVRVDSIEAAADFISFRDGKLPGFVDQLWAMIR